MILLAVDPCHHDNGESVVLTRGRGQRDPRQIKGVANDPASLSRHTCRCQATLAVCHDNRRPIESGLESRTANEGNVTGSDRTINEWDMMSCADRDAHEGHHVAPGVNKMRVPLGNHAPKAHEGLGIVPPTALHDLQVNSSSQQVGGEGTTSGGEAPDFPLRRQVRHG